MKSYLLILFFLFSCSSSNLNRIVKKVVSSDDYLFLEEIQGKKALAFSRAESKATLNHFKKDPRFQLLYKKNLKLLQSKDKLPSIKVDGEYIYNFWKDEKNPRGVLRRQKREDFLVQSSNWENLIDIDLLGKQEGKSWVYKGCNFSPDHLRCLMKLSNGGKDASEYRESVSYTHLTLPTTPYV